VLSTAPSPGPETLGLAPLSPPTGHRWLAPLLLVVITFLFTCVVFGLYTGAHPGTDQDGYLMTAREIAEEGRLWFTPADPYQFAGNMCIMTAPYETPSMTQPAHYRIYAKYPPGYPLLAAGARLLAGPEAMYWVNPLCAIAAIWMSYFLFRQALTPGVALLGVLLLAANPLTLLYADDANSHASVLFCVVVGFWGLLSWWRTDSLWRGFIGGLALGYACTIRYSEFLLVLPVLFAALVNLRWNRRRLLSCALLVLGWAIPVGILATICWVHFGAPWRTGYSFCHEDTGFGWKYFIGDNTEPTNPLKMGNWATLIQQLNHIGLFVFWPLALGGLLIMLTRAWRLGLVIALWVLPSTVLYLFYYWAPQGEQTSGYLRFFLTVVPGFLFAALWICQRVLALAEHDRHSSPPPWPSLVLVTLVALTAGGWIVFYYTPPEGTASWRYFIAAGFLLLALAIWIWERPIAARVAPLAVGFGALVALACGINVLNVVPQLENIHAINTALHQSIDAVHAAAPTGAMVIADEQLCNQLDAIGGYRLYNVQLFTPLGFTAAKRIYEKKQDATDDPNPLQWERAQFYMELLGRRADATNWVMRPPREKNADLIELARRAILDGQRVLLVIRSDDKRFTAAQLLPTAPGITSKKLTVWTSVQPVSPGGVPWFAGLRRPAAPAAKNRATAGDWVIYELYMDSTALHPAATPEPTAKSPPSTRPIPATRPVPRSVPATRSATTTPATLPATAPAAAPATAPATN